MPGVTSAMMCLLLCPGRFALVGGKNTRARESRQEMRAGGGGLPRNPRASPARPGPSQARQVDHHRGMVARMRPVRADARKPGAGVSPRLAAQSRAQDDWGRVRKHPRQSG